MAEIVEPGTSERVDLRQNFRILEDRLVGDAGEVCRSLLQELINALVYEALELLPADDEKHRRGDKDYPFILPRWAHSAQSTAI